MIKVFTTNDEPRSAGNTLTKAFEQWYRDVGIEIEVVDFKISTSACATDYIHRFTHMLTVQYKKLNNGNQ